jgi:hypothetical protein
VAGHGVRCDWGRGTLCALLRAFIDKNDGPAHSGQRGHRSGRAPRPEEAEELSGPCSTVSTILPSKAPWLPLTFQWRSSPGGRSYHTHYVFIDSFYKEHTPSHTTAYYSKMETSIKHEYLVPGKSIGQEKASMKGTFGVYVLAVASHGLDCG